MTPASRLRLRVALWRFTLAEWIAPPAACIANRAEVNRLIRSDERRRALAQRRWGRRATARKRAAEAKAVIDQALAAPAPKWVKLTPIVTVDVPIMVGEAVYRDADGKWWPSNRPTVCDVPGQYGPSGAADLGYVNKSQSTNKETS